MLIQSLLESAFFWFIEDLKKKEILKKDRDHPYTTSAHFWTFSGPPTLRQHE